MQPVKHFASTWEAEVSRPVGQNLADDQLRIEPLSHSVEAPESPAVHQLTHARSEQVVRPRQSLRVIAIATRLNIAIIIGLYAPASLFGQTSIILLKNGMQYGPGFYSEVNTIIQSSTKPRSPAGGNSIGRLDDGLREIYFHRSQRNAGDDVGVNPPIQIELGNKSQVATSGQAIMGIGPALRVSEFDNFGRRIYSLFTAAGRRDVVQGITEVSPYVIRVEGLNSDRSFMWDMRLALSALPPNRLRAILAQNAQSAQDWLDIVELYQTAERYYDADSVLREAIQRYPELERTMKGQSNVLRQRLSNQMLEEFQVRLDAHQYKMAARVLESAKATSLSQEAKIRIDSKIAELNSEDLKIKELVAKLKQNLADLDDPSMRSDLDPIMKEIETELTAGSAERLVDYRRLSADASIDNETLVALGIGGWLLGPGSGQQNLSTVRAVANSRPLFSEYLASSNSSEREQLLNQIRQTEAGVASIADQIIAQLKPPLPLPEGQQIAEHPGRYRLAAPLPPAFEGQTVEYLLQLPPEYDPNLRYPCIVALHGENAPLTTSTVEMQWWCGDFNERFQAHIGEAQRNGYIVICPEWTHDNQTDFNFTENEHARVLSCLRDGMRRVGVDSDRVFITGHHMGADAAWDLALAHPDLWAGLICISGQKGEITKQYRPNAELVPTYFVFGQHDGAPPPLDPDRNGDILDIYLGSSKYDCTMVIFQGRGRDHFQEELPNLVQWMGLSSHRRNPYMKEFEVSSIRAGDRFFWWLEIDQFSENRTQNPLLPINYKAVADIEAAVPTANNVRLKFPVDRFSILISPELFDFAERLNISAGKLNERVSISPDLEYLLEDARTRADRQHLYWAKVQIPQ